MRVASVSCWCLLIGMLASCGGRLVKTDGDGDDGDGATGQGGSKSGSGASSRGATSSRAGSTSSGARTGSGGAVSAGGKATGGSGNSKAGASSMGGACFCPTIDCAPGLRPVLNPDGCCFHCEQSCDLVPCPDIACGSGSHFEMLAGQCCPTCVQDSCKDQVATYQDFRKQLFDKYSTLGCMTANDCTVYYEKNQCAVGCGVVMPTAAIANLDSNLQSFAQQTCSPNCPPPLIPPCEPPSDPICFHNLCE